MLKNLWRKGKNIRLALDRQTGQSLVELAIALPILLLLFVSLMEVGLMLRSYMVLVNANREAARYAGRAVEFQNTEGEDVTNIYIAGRAIMSAESLKPNMAEEGGNFTIFIHRIQIDTGQPGSDADNDIRLNRVPTMPDDPEHPTDYRHTCTEWFTTHTYTQTVYITGTLVTALGEPRVSLVDPQSKCQQLFDDNESFNLDMATLEAGIERQTPPIGEDDGVYETSVLEVVIIETFYDHPQALKLPFFTVFIPDPLEMHCETQMRLTGVGRQAE